MQTGRVSNLWLNIPAKDGLSQNKYSSQESLLETLESYEKTFAEIKRVTGNPDMAGLVQRFKAVEDTNFSLFNYVNEINNDIEKLSEEISEAQGQINAMKAQGSILDEDEQHKVLLLETDLNSCVVRNKQYEQQYANTLYATSEIRAGVDKLVKIFQSTRFSFSDGQVQVTHVDEQAIAAAAAELHHESTSQEEDEGLNESNFTNVLRFSSGGTMITDTNLLQILGIIEHKMNEFMTLNYMFNVPRKITSAGSSHPTAPSNTAISGNEDGKPDLKSQNNIPPAHAGILYMPLLGTVGGLLGQGPIAPVGTISIIAPSTGDDHDSDDDNLSDEDDRPFTREELIQKTLRGVSIIAQYFLACETGAI